MPADVPSRSPLVTCGGWGSLGTEFLLAVSPADSSALEAAAPVILNGLRSTATIVTGANSDLGLETARALAGRGASVMLAVRDLDKGKQAIEAIRSDHPGADLGLQQLDLASLDSIRRASEEVGAGSSASICSSTKPG